jgi:hypothetical protein
MVGETRVWCAYRWTLFSGFGLLLSASKHGL